jgi:hypothetical protein
MKGSSKPIFPSLNQNQTMKKNEMTQEVSNANEIIIDIL